ncbi:DUF1572 family protein [Paenibacillus sp. MER 99-2]|uniref:DUF1572 family protein n=1 Tax=Paenibacillus sp. MER 99-2 TaxID=2939572 RepID=UPI002040E2A1|nr:DUF1572 family protein [Paenibacillus sp. MER 99-2]MCM3174725.1 DUF1572 domain-containing protein [Paenibacillus sp. MER 99-2]
MDLNQSFLETAEKQFLYYKQLGDKAMAQLETEQLFQSWNEDTNSIAVIVKHLWGNMLSRWTDVLTTDGEKAWRERDAEFINDLSTREELLDKWEEGWSCLLSAIRSFTPDQLSHIIYIRNEGHTVMEAIIRQLAHYPYHVGQMVYVAKMLKETSWDSLSIPRNGSTLYNGDKFAKPKMTKHFTDEELNREEPK